MALVLVQCLHWFLVNNRLLGWWLAKSLLQLGSGGGFHGLKERHNAAQEAVRVVVVQVYNLCCGVMSGWVKGGVW